jgi:hypothetical protein
VLTLSAGEVPAFAAERGVLADLARAAKATALALPEPWRAGAISANHPTSHAWRAGRVGWVAACGQKSSKDVLAWGEAVNCATCQASPLLRPAEPALPTDLPALAVRARALGMELHPHPPTLYRGETLYSQPPEGWPEIRACLDRLEAAARPAVEPEAETPALLTLPAPVALPIPPALPAEYDGVAYETCNDLVDQVMGAVGEDAAAHALRCWWQLGLALAGSERALAAWIAGRVL